MELKQYGIREEFETATNDFKEFLNDGKNANEWLKTVAAFANTKGGTLYDGIVNDNYNPKGFNKAMVDKQVQTFQRLVKEHIRPEPDISMRYLPIGEDKYVIEFAIQKSHERPVVCLYDGFPFIWIREEGKTRAATSEEIQRMALEDSGEEKEKVFLSKPFVADHFQQLFALFQEKNNRELTEKDLRSVGFFDDFGMLRKEAEYFADDYQGEDTALMITRYPSFGKGGSLLYPEPLFQGNILSGIQKVQEYVAAHAEVVYLKQASGAISTTSFPPRTVTEAIVNAYAHKNYFMRGSQIEVNLYLDRLEIVSPGALVGRGSLGKINDLSSLIPMRRNEFICNVLVMLKLMERRGSGFDKIESDYQPFGNKYAPFAIAREDSFTLVLPNLSYPYGVVGTDSADLDLVFLERPNEKPSTRKILSYCYFKDRSLEEIAKMLGVSVSSYLRNEILQDLVARKLLTVDKEGKKNLYHTNKDTVYLKGE